MKNKFLGIAFVFCIAVAGTLNVNLTKVENEDYSLKLEMLTAQASKEENFGWELWTQGPYKDEREYSSPCPDSTVKVSVCVEYNAAGACIQYEEKTEHSGRNEIDCLYGSSNCSETGWFFC